MGKTYFFFNSEPERESMAGLPDVYWDGKPEHGLPDDPKTGQPRVFGSKAEKARYLQEAGLREAGDRVHGGNRTPAMLGAEDSTGNPGNRDSALRALHQVKQLGQDVRRQAYLKILKDSGRI